MAIHSRLNNKTGPGSRKASPEKLRDRHNKSMGAL